MRSGPARTERTAVGSGPASGERRAVVGATAALATTTATATAIATATAMATATGTTAALATTTAAAATATAKASATATITTTGVTRTMGAHGMGGTVRPGCDKNSGWCRLGRCGRLGLGRRGRNGRLGRWSPGGRPLSIAAALAVAAVAILTAACGVPPDEEARTLAAEEVPYGLLDEAPVGAPPPTTQPVAKVNVTVFFLAGDRLQPAPRAVAEPATPLRAVNALLGGPTEEEAVTGLRTAINPSTEATITRPSPELVAVDLSSSFAAVPTQEQRLALAQIVYTATGLPGVTGVRFTLAGAPVEVPLPDGTLTSLPIGRNVFANVAPLVSSDPQPE